MTSSGSAVVTLPTDTEIVITREFDAPKHLVYRCYTEPDLVSRWWPGKRGEMTLCEIDLRVGGSYRYVMQANEGFEVAFHGEYREIVPNERIVHTEVFEGVPDGDDDPAVNIVTFEEADGRTKLTILTQVSSRQIRDMIIDSGMEGGLQEGMDLLEELAKSL
ncbi:MAG TPA: SRPBCC family protein [Solirubrobacter sp.]|nr:SRPBCC family protein [Solirubrobacter sp.]